MALLLDVVGTMTRVIYNTIEYYVSGVFGRRKSVLGEVVLITGGASGIGRIMAHKFSALGATVIVWDINADAAQKVADEINAQGGKAKGYGVDVSVSELVYETAKQVKQDVGTVNILINNAGVVSGRLLLDTPDHLIKRSMDVNITSHFWTTKAFLPDMMQANHGHVVTIASIAGLAGSPKMTDYSASKFACVGFNESLRQELYLLGKTNVHTTIVCPYFINTGMFDGAKTKLPSLLPILEPEPTAHKIVQSILLNKEMLVIPHFMNICYLLRALFPISAQDCISRFLGSQELMANFQGH